MNLPNKLTLLRFVLTIIFILFLFKDTFLFTLLAFIIFSLASLTDFLDGYIARKKNLITNFGKIMDPIADKFLVLSAFYVFASLSIMPAWMFWVIFVREVGITLWRFVRMSKGNVIAAESLGKYKTVLQMSAIIIILIFMVVDQSSWPIANNDQMLAIFSSFINILLIAAVILTVASGAQCLLKNISKG